MTQTMPTTHEQWPSPDGIHAGWTGQSPQQLPYFPSAARLTLAQTFFSPRGRIGRQSFWLATLLTTIAYLGGVFLAVVFPVEELQGPLVAVVLLLTLYVGTVVFIKRLHDRDYSGWMALIHFIPFFGPIWMLVTCCGDSNPGGNRFGSGTNPTPLG